MKLPREQVLTLTASTSITFTLVVAYMYQSQILLALSVAFWLLVLVAILAIIGGAWWGVEMLLRLRVSRLELEKQAHTMLMTNGDASYIRDTSSNAVYHSLHLQARPRFNTGESSEIIPTPQEMAVFQAFNAPKRNASQLALPSELEGEELPPLCNWLDVFTQPLQVYAILGSQQCGKTRQANHLAAKWLGAGIKPLVIGPKFDLGEWEGCELVGGKDDIQAVLSGINRVVIEAKRRHASPLSHKSHPILPVFFDDWSAIVTGCKDEARQLIFRAATTYASVNLVLYFLNHADTAPAWGIDKVGAALKDSFVKLQLTPTYNNVGKVIHSETKAVVIFPTETRLTQIIQGEVMPPTNPSDTPTLPLDEATPTLPPMSETEAKTMQLWESGEKRISTIAKQVYGNKGSHYNGKVEATLTRYNGYKKE